MCVFTFIFLCLKAIWNFHFTMNAVVSSICIKFLERINQYKNGKNCCIEHSTQIKHKIKLLEHMEKNIQESFRIGFHISLYFMIYFFV